jgi:hypothetical protein
MFFRVEVKKNKLLQRTNHVLELYLINEIQISVHNKWITSIIIYYTITWKFSENSKKSTIWQIFMKNFDVISLSFLNKGRLENFPPKRFVWS